MINQLKKFRKVYGLSQSQLAENVGSTRQTISNIEREVYEPGIYLASKIAQVFRSSIEIVFFGGAK